MAESTEIKAPQAAAQEYLVNAQHQAANIPDIPTDITERAINKVGVIGAGTMGGGIAMNMANVGIPVTVVETRQDALDRGLATIRKNYERTASKGRISQQDVEERCALISASLDLNEIAAATSRAQDVIGLHFFSPANVMKLLEVVRGEQTAHDVIKTCMAFALRIRKVAVLAGVCPGFIGNRMLFVRQLQAQQLILEGALPHQVDEVICDFGLPMGPYQMSDLAGLDLGWNRATSKGETIRDRLCELDRRGQKSGAGYYDYDENRQPTPSAVVEQIIGEFAARAGHAPRGIPDEEILQRCIYPMINEGAKILQEGIAIRASDIDVVWVYGYGWPVSRGGPMHYANSVGLDKIVAALQQYQQQTGDDFWKPCQLLVDLAEQGKAFS